MAWLGWRLAPWLGRGLVGWLGCGCGHSFRLSLCVRLSRLPCLSCLPVLPALRVLRATPAGIRDGAARFYLRCRQICLPAQGGAPDQWCVPLSDRQRSLDTRHGPLTGRCVGRCRRHGDPVGDPVGDPAIVLPLRTQEGCFQIRRGGVRSEPGFQHQPGEILIGDRAGELSIEVGLHLLRAKQ